MLNIINHGHAYCRFLSSTRAYERRLKAPDQMELKQIIVK